MTLKTRNNIQVHILNLLGIEFDMNLFKQLGTLWDQELETKN